jgi:hypothetical protein
MTSLDTLRIILIGCGATLMMDAWVMLLKRFGVQTLNFAFIGRWFGHLFQGRFMHASISKAPPVSNELLLGWLVHYVIGIAFAGMLVGITGMAWLRDPTWIPAALVGIGTVVAPFFIMQPAMGSGIAGAKAPAPMKGRLRSVTNHAVFGLGLYLSAWLIAWILR